jgi:hypothetical protein
MRSRIHFDTSGTLQKPELDLAEPRKPGSCPKAWYARWINCAAAVLLVPLTLWAGAALYFDLPIQRARVPAAVVYLAAIAGLLIRTRPLWKAVAYGFACFAIVCGWWLSLPPSNVRDWQPDVAESAWAEVEGNRVTIHNVRNCIYRSEADYTPRWETRIVDVASIVGADLFLTWWGSPWIAHPIVSFHHGADRYLAFSIEVRKEMGEGYSAIRGFFRQFELIYIVSDEKDVVRLRTNYRRGEEVYAYRLRVTPEEARALFLEYIRSLNRLRQQPEWYNALTTNCTTDIRKMAMAATGSAAIWDWRILLNGRLDQLLHERGRLAGDLLLPELKQRSHINAVARASGEAPDFSQRIRAGRPGF